MKQQLLNFYNDHQTLIWPIVSTIFCILLLFLLIIPSILRIRNGNKDIAKINQEQAQIDQQIKQLSSIDIGGYSGYLGKAQKILPLDKEITGAIDQVQTLVNTNNLQIESLSIINGGQGGKSIDNFGIKMTTIGSFASIQNLLASLKNSARLMNLSTADITSPGTNKLFSADLAITIYYKATVNLTNDTKTQDLNDKERQLADKINQQVQTVQTSPQGNQSLIPKGKANPFQ